MHVGDDGSVWGRSEVLGLDVWWSEEKVRLWDRESERWLLSHEEEQAGRLEAEARVAELEAELRRLRGVDRLSTSHRVRGGDRSAG